ncbi:cadherin-related family member 1 isoform X8 [Cherax quadricarinatus]|uniref:cadherin-related family member 1 isoform X8 n=1 Tax=Cherax quadricarinatus TaxID=27406 RepID=UPI00387EBCC7
MITKERWAVPVTAVPFTAVPVTATPKKLQDSAQTSPAMAFTRRREQTFAHTKTTAAILILLFLLPAPALCQNCTNHCEVTGGAKLSGLSGILILQANVDEKTDEGTDLYILNCSNTGPFTGPDEEEFLHYFSVDNSQSSELRVSVSTSLNGVPDFPNNTEQILGMVKFSLLDNVTNCQVQLEHNIVDENTQNPEINQTNYEVQIREDFPADLSLYYLTVLVSDNDATSPNNEFSLEVQDCPLETSEAEYGGPGTINEVQFQLTSKLDYEKQKSYTCTITAKDKGSPVLSSQPSSITITVQDMPDEPPIFTYNYYYIEITSTLPSDEPLEIQPGAVYATDGDTEIKSPITYSMIDADPEGVGMNYFKIDSSTGNVTLTRELDEEILINLSIDFFITAEDSSGATAMALLNVGLPWPGHLDNNTLYFELYQYATEVLQPQVADVVLRVKAQVANSAYEVTYNLTKPDGNFGIDPKSGEITVLNGDVASGSYTLTAVAVVENTSLRDEAKVYIKVLHPSTTTVTMINSLLKETLQEDSQESLIREIKTEGDTGPVCIISVEPDAAVGKFDVVQQEGGSWVLRKIAALDYETTQEIKLKLQVYETGATCLGITSTSDDLLRSQALVIITVTDINDQQPEFQVPHAPNTIIAYPQDKALQNVVGPVITLQASDNDTVGDLSYGLSNSSSGAPFTVESNTGAVFVENEFVCSKECSLEVKVSDGATEDSHASIKVVPLDMDHISTIVLQNTDVSQVDDYLQTLSDKSGVQVSNLYVSPIIEDSSVQNSPSTLLLYSRIRQGRGWSVTSNSLQVHVYSIDSDGNLMSVEDLNKALSDGKTNVVAQEFTDKALFQCVDDTNETSNTGLKVAVGILGALLGLILLAALAFLVYKKRRDGRAKPIASTPINTLGRAYPNLSYSEEHEGKRESLRSRDHKTNGTLNSLSNGRSTSSRDSPPLFLSTLSSQKSESPKSEHQYRGLRRVDAGSPEYYGISSPAPPPSFTKITSFSSTDPNDYNTTTTTPLYTVASTSNASMPDSTSIYPALDTIPESPTHIYAEINKPAKNEPADISPPPAKSILKHKSESSLDTSVIPAVSGTDEAKPQEPDADYDETEEPSSSSFLALKGSPPPRKHSTASANGDDDDSVSDHDGITYPGGKKSNLKQHDGDAGSDYEKKSVAFKVLVDTKEIEAENLSPASKIAAVKSDALLLMEANKKKLEEENDDNDDIDGNDADNDASEEDEKL